MTDKDKKKKKKQGSWPLRVFLLAVALSAVLSFFSSSALEGAGYAVAIIVLAVFIGLGIVFDMVGVAVTAADPKPFHSMAAHKEKGGREAIRLLQQVFAAGASYEGEMPGCSAAECGNYRNLDVALARDCCRYYAEVIADWNVEKLVYPTGK